MKNWRDAGRQKETTLGNGKVLRNVFPHHHDSTLPLRTSIQLVPGNQSSGCRRVRLWNSAESSTAALRDLFLTQNGTALHSKAPKAARNAFSDLSGSAMSLFI